MPKKQVFARQRMAQRKIALARIRTLFEEASTVFATHPEWSNRYVQLARKIAMRAQVRVPRELKRKMCKQCFNFLVPGRNCMVRTREGHVIYHCKTCGGVMRYPYVREKK